MVKISFAFFTITVILGIIMAYYGLRGKQINKGLALLHGLAAVTGMILLVIYAITTEHPHKHIESIVLFSLAVLVGGYLLGKDLTSRKAPPAWIIVHGLIAASGYIMLLVHII